MPQLDTRTGIVIDPARDEKLTPFAKTLMRDFYLRAGETPQLGHARAARAWCGGDLLLAQRLYDYASKGWFMWASPVLSNAPLPGEKIKGMPISCFLNFVDDTLESLIDVHTPETRWLAVLGGGVGGHWSQVRSVSKKAPGPIPFMHTMDADMEAYKQGAVRRGSYAAYLDISHPDIAEFINIRLPTGDTSRKCLGAGFHHGVNITDAFMEAVIGDKPWDLIDPHDGAVRDTVNARELWQEILEIRYRTGEPYLHFIDASNRALPESQKALGLRVNGSNLCSEITLPTNAERTAVCCLSSLNAETYDEWCDTNIVGDLIEMLDNVLDAFIKNAPKGLARAVHSAIQERSLGLGLMGFHAYLQKLMVPFESQEARSINREMFNRIQRKAVERSEYLGSVLGEPADMLGTGRRNAHLIALAPNANSSILLATSPSIEVAKANAYKHQTRAGTWPVKNRYLERLLEAKGKNTDEVWQDVVLSKGSVQHLDFLTENEKAVFKTAIEIDQMWVVTHAADRQEFICQAQSLNLFFPPRAQRSYINSVHIAAWEQGLKSLYYARTEAPNRVEDVSKTAVRTAGDAGSERHSSAAGDCRQGWALVAWGRSQARRRGVRLRGLRGLSGTHRKSPLAYRLSQSDKLGVSYGKGKVMRAAERIARQLHAEQTDKQGRPYVEHLEAVVSNLLRRWPDAPYFAVDAAWLHDAMEDQGATKESLIALGVSRLAVAIVFNLSRPKGTTYRGWIEAIAAYGTEWEVKVKLADNEHNADPARRIPGTTMIEDRYLPARSVLEKHLAERFGEVIRD
jgi:ribonucleoside-diphosphate reductase alpha chain